MKELTVEMDQPMTPTPLPDETRVARVDLRTADLAGAVGFYTEVLGLAVIRQTGAQALLGASSTGPPLVVLHEEPAAVSRPERTAGLYHLALRYPARRDLGRALLRLVRKHAALEGASDHWVSEALYLRDPEGNGVELYADRPREHWGWRDGQVRMATEALDLDKLLSTVGRQPELATPPPKTDLGHVHLQVTDLAEADRFYHDFLGLAVTQRSYPGALFFSAGGYHHHIAANTWAGKRPAPQNSVGLVSYRLEVPVAEVLYCLEHRAPLAGYEATRTTAPAGEGLLRIRDPNGYWLEVQAKGPPAG